MFKWVVSPAVIVGGLRRPLCATLRDSGRPYSYLDGLTTVFADKEVLHSSCYNPAMTLALSLLSAEDFSNIIAHPQVDDLFGGVYDAHPGFLEKLPTELPWDSIKRKAVSDRFGVYGVTFKDTEAIFNPVKRLMNSWLVVDDPRNVTPSSYRIP